MKTNFHNKNFAFSLTFIMRFKATRKWPIYECDMSFLFTKEGKRMTITFSHSILAVILCSRYMYFPYPFLLLMQHYLVFLFSFSQLSFFFHFALICIPAPASCPFGSDSLMSSSATQKINLFLSGLLSSI